MLFRRVTVNVFLRLCRSFSFVMAAEKSLSETLNSLDQTQVKLLKEGCILVDENDHVTGTSSKLDCHLISNGPPLHRAFSVFLFNEKNELLMQRRAMTKITFPGFYTNTCCSHPLHNEAELDENGAIGVKRAAQRKIKQELGIVPEQFPLENMKYITRIHYKAPCEGDTFGEHEIDYILFAKGTVDLQLNPNEVSEVTYLPLGGVKDFVDKCRSRDIQLTPWFNLVLNSHLMSWWKELDNVEKHFNHKEIMRM